jgi:hypothetical protein
MRISPPGPSASAPEGAEVPDDDGSADHSIVTGDVRVPRALRGEVHGAHAEPLRDAPDERRREHGGDDDDERERRPGEQSGGKGERRRRRGAPPRDRATVPGERDELVRAPEGSLLPRAPTVAVDAGPTAEPGDLRLTDPELARRALVTPHAYAKHCMILAEAFRRATGATRSEGVAYLARLFLALADPQFGRAALRELGPATGIVDLYPLELLEHVIDLYPGFVPKVARGRFVQRDPPELESFAFATDTPLVLSYKAELKVRGFAVVGGARPGYRFEPCGEGAYTLRLDTPGRYTVAVSCLSRTGQVVIDRLELRVRAGLDARAPLPLDEGLPPRDPDKIAAWPVPAIPAARRDDALVASDTRRDELCARFSAEELAQRIGVLGLANLRARLAVRRDADGPSHEETHPSWAGPARLVMELDAEHEALPVARPRRGEGRAPASRAGPARELASPHDEGDEAGLETRVLPAPRDPGVASAGARPSVSGLDPRPSVSAPEPGISAPEPRTAPRVRVADAEVARALVAEDEVVREARREGPMVMAPRGLGAARAEPRSRAAPEPALDDDEVEGEEPTSDLEPDATMALDRARLGALGGDGAMPPDPSPWPSGDGSLPLVRAVTSRELDAEQADAGAARRSERGGVQRAREVSPERPPELGGRRGLSPQRTPDLPPDRTPQPSARARAMDPSPSERVERAAPRDPAEASLPVRVRPARAVPPSARGGRAEPEVDPTRPIVLRPQPPPRVEPPDPEPTRPIDLSRVPGRKSAAVVVRTVAEVDPTRPLDARAVADAIAGPAPTALRGRKAATPPRREAPASHRPGQPGTAGRAEPDTRPIVVDPSTIGSPTRAPTTPLGPAPSGPGFVDVRPHDRTQPIRARPPAVDDDDEAGFDDEREDHTLAELDP